MSYRKFFIAGVLLYTIINLTGCLTFHDIVTKDTPNTLAEYLKLRKNYWYVLDKDGFPVLFYNDYQDYTLIIKAKHDTKTNILYERKSLIQPFDLSAKNIKLPPECKGTCVHFLYKGKKALFFDLDKFCYENGDFGEFIINDSSEGYIYANLRKSFESYFLEPNILRGIEYYRVIQAEPDFRLLDLPSVKKLYQSSDAQ
ncbi:MAG: hypothetical protein A2017_01220 [Lentisphaerae bacterium GWF2_44_16]|nr:MAG: hypothetical protein A2017_01220 [Lentisphaerae bacterium GWF2_44_16]